ncbi:MAG: rhodanese-like domain-containing protein [Ruminococcus sp.]|nr:rhodanese-like domain-containing protein [Ruminococcus sp.]
MRKIIPLIAALAAALSLGGCSANDAPITYTSIPASEAKALMDSETDYIILDVRTEKEYADGHIPDAILIPDYEIAERAENELTDKSQLILVYCRSGRRSKNAAEKLAEMGYSNVKEFGGIIEWGYETTAENNIDNSKGV